MSCYNVLMLANKYWTKRRIKLLVSALVTLLVLLSGGYTQRDVIKRVALEDQPGLYRVTEVVDGDTIKVDMAGKTEEVRFIGVDTPELHHPKKPVQCFAEAAKQFTTQLIGHNRVRLQADPEDDNRDIYQRLLRYIYLPDGTLVNAELVKQGYGFAYTYFPFTKLEEMRQYEHEARLNGRGLWSGCTIEQGDQGIQTNDAASGT